MRTSIVPHVRAETRGYWEGCARGELSAQRCVNCGRLRFPPQPMCPNCHSMRREWVPISGAGAIYSFSVVTGEGAEPQLPGARGLPFAIAVIELDDGIRMVTDFDTEEIERLAIGSRVEVFFEPVDEQIQMPRFALVQTQPATPPSTTTTVPVT
jgi:uncharacterized OB-fold protein